MCADIRRDVRKILFVAGRFKFLVLRLGYGVGVDQHGGKRLFQLRRSRYALLTFFLQFLTMTLKLCQLLFVCLPHVIE